MSRSEKPLSFDETALPALGEADDETLAWQAAKVRAGLKDADEGRFASDDAVKAVVHKFLSHE